MRLIDADELKRGRFVVLHGRPAILIEDIDAAPTICCDLCRNKIAPALDRDYDDFIPEVCEECWCGSNFGEKLKCWMFECAMFTEDSDRKSFCGMHEDALFPVTSDSECLYPDDREPISWYAD